MKVPEDMKKGCIHPSNYGDVEVIAYEGYYAVKVMFLRTKNTVVVDAGNLRRKCIKDKMSPNILGVAFHGNGKYNTKDNVVMYQCWRNMIGRCYDKTSSSYRYYGAVGVAVCDEWLNYQNFAKWYDENIQDGERNQLDKDIKIEGNKIYSPETCEFVTKKENTAKARAKTHRLINPSGELVEIYNLRDFCSKNNLNQTNMHRVMSGSRKTHKGWSKPKP